MRTIVLALLVLTPVAVAAAQQAAIGPETVHATVARLVTVYGPSQEARIRQGVTQVAQRWWAEDGDAGAFTSFCEASFIADPGALAATFARLERVCEQTYGHLHELRRELLTPLDLDTGPVATVDRLLSQVDLSAHVAEDLFQSKVAFLALLNFPVHSLTDRLAHGAAWDRETWARSRMMDGFAERIPSPVLQAITRATTAADQYIAEYNIRLDRLVTPDGRRLFPEGLRVISHWGLRDELASHYGEANGLERQRMIVAVMERIVRQEIPAAVIDNANLLWCPQTNHVQALSETAAPSSADLTEREADVRYARWLANFHAMRAADAYTPAAPSVIARAFERDRQIPEEQVEALLDTVLASAEVRQLGALIARRLGRPLEPFDIWYSGFKSRATYSETDLDALVRARYPSVEVFQADLPNILRKLGFAPDKAAWLAAAIVVDPARGSGHAMGAARREDKAHLRTRIPAAGMDYKGYNIAIHELGHNVEQTFSLQGVDHWFLNGVPNNAFTEAFAYSFQDRDLELLGLPQKTTAKGVDALRELWFAYEIGGVSLVDLKAWRFLYAHPEATPAELREAVRSAAREVWNRYYAPLFGVKDQEILAIYSHMVAYPLYLADYAIAHIIAFQVEAKLRGGGFGAEFERMARQGRLTPDAWMRAAVGGPISVQALLAAAREALARPL
jgi:hypothetical protein